ncbi:MAG TPA: EAL domain-containing protein [Acidimicrobiia bacterium]
MATTGSLSTAEEELRLSEQRFRALVQHASELMLVWDRHGRITYASPATIRFAAGVEPDQYENDIEGTNVFLHPDDLPRVRDLVMDLAMRPGATERFLARYRRHDGEYRSLEVTVTNLLSDPAVRGLVANSRDITETLAYAEALQSSEAWFRSLVQHSSDMIVVIDREGHVRYVSPGIEALLSVPGNREAARLAQHIHPDDRAAVAAHVARASATPGPQPPIEMRAQHADGSWLWLEAVYTNQLSDPAVEGLVVNVRDITERKEAEARIAHQALHDGLTGLPNRALLFDRLTHALERAERSGTAVGVIFLDLDRFKVVNDAHGHGAGDALLTSVAVRLQIAARATDTIARFGGDEFVLVCEDVDGIDGLVEIAHRVCASLKVPFDVADRRVHCTASAGVALSRGSTDPEALLRDADAAMYEAKDVGRGSVAVFDHAVRVRVHTRVEIERALRDAIDRDELTLEYQPIVTLGTPSEQQAQDAKIVGVEALLRWQHPQRGTVAPAAFIDLAEETGLIVPIGAGVLQRGLEQLAGWHEIVCRSRLGVAINVSAVQLQQAELPSLVDRMLDRTGIAPERLTLEITESSLVEDTVACADRLAALKDIGVRIVLDDFGVQHSSLGYLNRMPLDGLKIDRSFVHRIGSQPREAAIVSAILLMADTLGLAVVAEGVETPLQHDVLTELGCRYAQGFLYAPPQPPEDLLPLLVEGRLPTPSHEARSTDPR